MSQVDVLGLGEIAAIEFADIVAGTFVPGPNELRIHLWDGSFIDVWFSLKLANRYSLHWERQAIDGTIYRHDNAPHDRWRSVVTFPDHFHNGREDAAQESQLGQDPPSALLDFLTFARDKLRGQISSGIWTPRTHLLDGLTGALPAGRGSQAHGSVDRSAGP